MRRNPSLIRDQEPRPQLSVAECALLLTRLMSQWDRLEIVTTGVCGMQQTRHFLTAATSGSRALSNSELLQAQDPLIGFWAFEQNVGLDG